MKLASTAKKGAKIVTMMAAATAMCEAIDTELDTSAMMSAMRDMGIPVEERAAKVVDMFADFGFTA